MGDIPSWEAMGFGPYPVLEISQSTITVSDGTELAVKYWIPTKLSDASNQFKSLLNDSSLPWTCQIYNGKRNSKEDERFPVILEYLPYYKDGFTTARDHERHPWFTSRGFVPARIEIRGTGASTGFYYDEYSKQEMLDCSEVIEWFAKQPWCNGKVDMYGKSWGGFNGLQMAYKQPDLS